MQITVWGHDIADSGNVPLRCFWEYRNEPLGSVKVTNFLTGCTADFSRKPCVAEFYDIVSRAEGLSMVVILFHSVFCVFTFLIVCSFVHCD